MHFTFRERASLSTEGRLVGSSYHLGIVLDTSHGALDLRRVT